MDQHDAVTMLCEKISNYLTSHPFAVDSANGIAQWWLGNNDRIVNPYLLQAALDVLVDQRRVTCRVQFDGTVLYSSSSK